MRRQRIIAGLILMLAAPLAAEAQQEKVYRVGVLLQGSPPAPGSQHGMLTRAWQSRIYRGTQHRL